jgi:sugar O-acyltransferase (sialic acid O-acetyltransferase NeuD family)
MTELYIIGTGGGAKEIVQLIEQINFVKPQFILKGFVVHDSDVQEVEILGKMYSQYMEDHFIQNFKGAAVVISNGAPNVRKKLFELYHECSFPNLIHPGIDFHHSVEMGKGNIFKIGIILTTAIKIGDNNYFNRGIQIGHDNIIGSHNVINPGAILSGTVTIGDACLIGTHATILQNLCIEDNVQVGGASIVTKPVPANQTVIGVPAKSL